MKLENKIILGFTMFVLIGSVANWAYYYGYLRTIPYIPTDFHESLLTLRFVVSVGILGSFIGILLRSFWGKILSIISILLILSFYVLWYFEKFKWIEGWNIKEGTLEYTEKLNEIGWFRGANNWDIFVLIFTLILFIWALSRYKYKDVLE